MSYGMEIAIPGLVQTRRPYKTWFMGRERYKERIHRVTSGSWHQLLKQVQATRFPDELENKTDCLPLLSDRLPGPSK